MYEFLHTERHERVDKGLLAVDAVVSLVVEERVGGGAAVAHRQQVVAVVERLRSDGDGADVHGLL